jgi:hypothetical protein
VAAGRVGGWPPHAAGGRPVTDAKTCPVCGREFTRAPGCSRWNFDRRTYCSMACRNRAAVLHRRKAGCPITTGRGHCGEPVTRWGWCERHAADHARLCPGGCGRCGR